MGVSILVIGEAGSGKSRAIKNLDPKRTVILRPNRKDLPFQGSMLMYKEGDNEFTLTTFKEVGKMLNEINNGKTIDTVIIEDVTHFLSRRVIDDGLRKDYDKWTELAIDVFNNIVKFDSIKRDNLNLIMIGHTMQSSSVSGGSIITLRTPGRFLDEKINIPSYFTYVLHTDVSIVDEKPNYRFLTNTDGFRAAKSPEGCLDLYEPNDYRIILDKIDIYKNKKVTI